MRLKFLCILLIALTLPHLGSAQSLDEIYRDIVKADNEGYLPLYVKNRQAPDFLDDDVKEAAKMPGATKKDTAPINLVDTRQLAEQKKREEELRWQNTIDAIKLNQVTPVELNIIESKVADNDPKATEIYAWMLARGVGIGQDLIKSFNMYQRAAFLNVPDAEKNAVTVYHAMSPDQRSQIKPMSILEDVNT